MKLSKLYCNKPFHNIKFNIESNKLNVIWGDAKKKETTKDQHNLGKSKILLLIDFLLLKKNYSDIFLFTSKIQTNQEIPFYDKKNILHAIPKKSQIGSPLFKDYEFYLEIFLNDGRFLLIKRTVNNPTKISFKNLDASSSEFIYYDSWDEENIPIDKAQKKLNEWLDFDFCKKMNEDYRRIVNYSLRMQGDYDYQRNSIFQLSKFKGKDIDWKPLMFGLLGFEKDIPYRKYELEKEIEDLRKIFKEQRNTFGVRPEEIDSLVGQKQLKEQEFKELTLELENLNFYKQDKSIIDDLVGNVENTISDLNSQLYNLEYDISKLHQSIKNGFSYDMAKVKNIFEEVNIYFPDQLLKSYEQLVNFNKKITQERNSQIRITLQEKEKQSLEISNKLIELNNQKEKYRDLINDTSIIKKYKEYQRKVIQLESDLIQIQNKLDSINTLETKETNIKETKGKELEKKIAELKSIIANTLTNKVYMQIRKIFSEITKKISHSTAYISMSLNKSNNIEFECKYDNSAKDEGNTYYKLLCIAYDLAIQCVYSSQSYFRFIYHDDAFANLANTRRTDLLKTVREYSTKHNLQYIFSIIKDDVPSESFNINEDEIILSLHDRDESGKLFHMNF